MIEKRSFKFETKIISIYIKHSKIHFLCVEQIKSYEKIVLINIPEM